MLKIEFIWSGSKNQLVKIQSQFISLEGAHVPVSREVTCLEVRLDSQLTFSRVWLAVASTICDSYEQI